MGKKIRCLLLTFGLAFGLLGCQSEEEKQVAQPAKRPDEQADVAEKAEETSFTFRDVEGNSYEAPLLLEVPKHSYDYTKLSEEQGLKYYKNADGTVVSAVGVDVSKYQSEVDWEQVKNAGIEFVIVRLGFRAYGESGALHEDPLFRTHVEGAFNAGLDVGVYFFSQAISEAEALEEADFVLERIKEYPITYPVVFDTEEIKNDTARTDHLQPEEYTNFCITFCEAVKEAGYDTMIYANMKWLAFTLDLAKLREYKIWYADYEAVPQIPYEFQMWQYTESGTVPGIEGNADINICFQP